MYLALLIVIFAIILRLDLPALITNRWYKEIIVYGILFLAAVYMGLAQIYQLPIFRPFQE
ncbi:MAG: hypothetical protein ACOX6I_10420 [Syntrophomonadaceae bacterium]|jgi:hypothetical protein